MVGFVTLESMRRPLFIYFGDLQRTLLSDERRTDPVSVTPFSHRLPFSLPLRMTTHQDGLGQGDGRRSLGDPIPNIPEEFCVRIGVDRPREPLSRDQILQEIDKVGMGRKIAALTLEGPDASYPYFQWCRVYFNSVDEADNCVTLLNAPNRQWRWPRVVTQRLPLTVADTSDVDPSEPVFQLFAEHPPDCLTIDAQEGQVYFSTTELFKSRGLTDFFETKKQGRSIRRLICKHFDPEKRTPCRFGAECGFVHVRAQFMNRLLRTVPHQQQLRLVNGRDEEIQISAWEYSRRQDTLLIRDLDATLDESGLRYMFENCPGFVSSFLRESDGGRYGIVRFADPIQAANALLQTFDSGLNISFWGVLEDIRGIQTREAKANPAYEAEYRRRLAARQQPSGKSAGSAGELPFPPLPEGWTYGLSRNKNRYYFYQIASSEQTAWKHPVTNEEYKA
jgi:hypothetical protein